MYKITAQTLLNEVTQLYHDQNFKMMQVTLRECEQGIFEPDISVDTIFKHTAEIGFELVAYQILFEQSQALTLEHIQGLCQQFDQIFAYFDAGTWNDHINSATQTYLGDLQTLLRLTGDITTLQQVFTFVAQGLTQYFAQHQNDVVTDVNDTQSINQIDDNDATIEGTKRVRRLLRKYGLDDSTPFIFSNQDQPQINMAHLEQWGLHNKIVVTTHQDGSIIICYLEKRYFDLYCKVFNIKS